MALIDNIRTALGSAWHVGAETFYKNLLPAVDGTAEANKVVTADANQNVTLTGKVTAASLQLSGSDTIAGNQILSTGVVAAAGTNQATATALTNDINYITGADGTKGVALPAGAIGMKITVENGDGTNLLKVYPNGASNVINALTATTALRMTPKEKLTFEFTAANQWQTGKRVASGQATTATASDTIVTGLDTLVSVVANLDDAPTTDPEIATGSIGNQAGAPAAGSFLLQTWKTLGATPVAATTFAKKANWVATGY